jgi:hypothetical protein
MCGLGNEKILETTSSLADTNHRQSIHHNQDENDLKEYNFGSGDSVNQDSVTALTE